MPSHLRQAALRYAAEALAALGRPGDAARHLVAALEGAAGDGGADMVRASSWLVVFDWGCLASGWGRCPGIRFLNEGITPRRKPLCRTCDDL